MASAKIRDVGTAFGAARIRAGAALKDIGFAVRLDMPRA
jgi:hypothetical protein